MTQVFDLTEQSFNEVAGRGVVLIDFWAPWCGPCRLQHPILERVAERLGDRATVARVNVDEAPGLAERFGVMSIPTLVLLKDGKEIGRSVGVTDETALVQAIEGAL